MDRSARRRGGSLHANRGGQRQVPRLCDPSCSGLDTFAGAAGAISTYHYRGPAPYLGKRVLVAGCAVSALEIAADLAQVGAARVVLTQRRQRYVLPKFAAGVPSDHRIFTRYGALGNEALPAAEIDRQLKEIVVEAGGSPEQYGAPTPDGSTSRPASPSIRDACRWSPKAESLCGRG